MPRTHEQNLNTTLGILLHKQGSHAGAERPLKVQGGGRADCRIRFGSHIIIIIEAKVGQSDRQQQNAVADCLNRINHNHCHAGRPCCPRRRRHYIHNTSIPPIRRPPARKPAADLCQYGDWAGPRFQPEWLNCHRHPAPLNPPSRPQPELPTPSTIILASSTRHPGARRKPPSPKFAEKSKNR